MTRPQAGSRVLWLVTCSGGLLAAVYLISCVWVQYNTSPTITSIESTHFPIWNIPFPAVTICNVNKVHLSAVRSLYSDYALNLTLKEDDYLSFVQQLAEIIQPEQASTFMELEKVLLKHNLTMETLMLKLTQPCSSLLVKCKWRGQLVPCDSLYSMHKTDAGFCCSFNYHPPDKTASRDPLLHVNGAGYLAGVTMLMDPQLEDYYAALFSFYGLQVLVHAPTDYPEISARGIILAPQKEAFLQVPPSHCTRSCYAPTLHCGGLLARHTRTAHYLCLPRVYVAAAPRTKKKKRCFSTVLNHVSITSLIRIINFITTFPPFWSQAAITVYDLDRFRCFSTVLNHQDCGHNEKCNALESNMVSAAATYSTRRVRGLGVSQRQCLFQDERQLNMSSENTNSTYSYNNCLIKCRLEHMARLCNCTPYFYPDTGTTRQCGLTDVECLAKHRRVFINLHSPGKVLGLQDSDSSMKCDCHPTCTDVVYTTELSQGNFFKSEYDRTHFFKEVNITNQSILHVYFKDLSILRFRRDVIYSWNDLLASFGGIVGLCLGCSLLSLVEMIYYFTVRPTCSALQHNSANALPVTTIKVAPLTRTVHHSFKSNSTISPRNVPPPYNWVY
ncbi:sodium channel protein Nach-like [Bacillus rossius redtenbacheri]|uniref:sodium channel protein Nach-like n=1 Tax=Bacillus rossius redtenbacheri TaxID=93214 RepID=UPI002FDE819D